ncbi:conjugal transfer protein TraB [Citrobacter freundii]|nr:MULTISPECIES: TraB/VirB10 family protein [Gammaproteobacteria]EEA2350420.1 conjugal transfer protein TraB [Salmonella enterica subsp. enterica serovar Enteritidis]EEC4304198.1 conjugal transfer protein TraB [Salmonella enterica subsp. enterica serovar Enteritidis]EEN2406622.1 conjugal transfer protein TraB [Salmonella enterica subsp. enterica serovar Enteritidis]EES8921238.1 conjugal transfer protein TraB [Escherichia coli]EES9862646.1 conjugal transfer protein TraB [Escherichia coli]
MSDNKYPIIEKARAWFYRQPSANQKKMKKYGTIGAFMAVALGIYYFSGRADRVPVVPEKKTDISAGKTDAIIQDDVVTTLRGDIKDLGTGIDGKVQDAVAQAIKDGKFNLPPNGQTAASGSSNETDTPSGTSSLPSGQNASASGSAEYPGANSFPAPAGYTDTPPAGTRDDAAQPAPAPLWVGSISEGNGDIGLQETAQEPAEKKDVIQLPVGFMKAKLLVGVNALTGQYGTDNPQTLMFRVQAPAQLPNFIKMNLKGCFAIANVSGNLSSERIIVLPVSMNCMTMSGQYIVEGSIKGFVSDRDGKRDMSARVVSRAGRLLAGTVFAKSIEGFANVIGNQSIQQNVSALGSVNTIKPDQAAQNAAATGVAGGFSEVSKYLLNLAQQTSPALETGPGKDVMLFIQETADLTIKQVRIK